MKHVVILSGAGLSAESGLPTFRSSDGLWEGHRIEDVATPEAWQRNPQLVLDFYNERRKKAQDVRPNRGHELIAELEESFEVSIITQNVDDLHEKAGSSNVLHIHGSLFESRSTRDESLVYPIKHWEMKLGDTCEKGHQLRPNIVWFNESVPLLDRACEVTSSADAFVVVGTSLQVYPAAGLIHLLPRSVPKFLVDPNLPSVAGVQRLECFAESASTGMAKVRDRLVAIFR
ncbi:MAG: NAD-dependent deacylase [Verrucomicrobia bacterium]|nr:NAD-dependent deacylase [Verrucomicrobiota bacterium]